MKPEPLKNKIKREGHVLEYPENIDQHIKSACEFFLRYKDNPDLLEEEYPEFANDPFLVKLYNREWFGEGDWIEDSVEFLKKYNEWLFKHSFSDVFTEKERKPMETEELKELFRKHNIGFEDICRFWITTYPEDIFSEKTSVGKITRLMKKILEEKERG